MDGDFGLHLALDSLSGGAAVSDTIIYYVGGRYPEISYLAVLIIVELHLKSIIFGRFYFTALSGTSTLTLLLVISDGMTTNGSDLNLLKTGVSALACGLTCIAANRALGPIVDDFTVLCFFFRIILWYFLRYRL